MAKKTTFVKLPCLTSLTIDNYSLYQSSWSYDIQKGMNLFVGTNGIGKTTTTSLIIFGIVGYDDNLSNEYFKSRGESIDPSQPSIIKIDFTIGDHKLTVERLIEKGSINALSIDSESFNASEIDNLDEVYEELLTKFTNVTSLDDIVFLLRKFLIREEEGNYLLWDDKGGEQSKLIRILINNAGFEEEYNKIAREVKDLDTFVRGKQDVRAQFVKRFKALKYEKDEELKTKENFDEITKLESHQKLVLAEIKEFQDQQEKSLDNIKYITSLIKEVDSNIEKVSSEYEILNEGAISSEKAMFTSIYSDEKVLTAIHKLKHYHNCIYCNHTINDTRVRAIVQKVELQNQCPVCDSRLTEGVEEVSDITTEELLIDLEKKQQELAEFKRSIDGFEKQKRSLKRNLDECWESHNKLEKNLHQKSIEANDLRVKLANFSKNPENKITSFDSQIEALQKQIQQFDEEIDPKKIELEVAKNRLIEKNKEQNLVMSSFEQQLNNIFKKYSSKYFKSECKLASVNRKPKESNITLTSFVPEFENKVRVSIQSCSTSQRIFLEYLFRLSLLELYTDLSGYTPFVMLETSEGAFDIVNTNKLAKSLCEFSENGIPLIVIANFSKKDFLKELVNGISSSKDRFVNFLEFGSQLNLQKEEQDKYAEIIEELNLV